MTKTVIAFVHSIAEDGLPTGDMSDVAFLFDGNIVSGWPLERDSGDWEADSDVGRVGKFRGVTHWVDFGTPLLNMTDADLISEQKLTEQERYKLALDGKDPMPEAKGAKRMVPRSNPSRQPNEGVDTMPDPNYQESEDGIPLRHDEKVAGPSQKSGQGKSFHNSDVNTTTSNVPDVQFFGDGDTFKLLCKASSESEGWMKSTKAMEIVGVGCVVQVTTQQHGNVAEAVVFIPDVEIRTTFEGGEVTGRQLRRV